MNYKHIPDVDAIREILDLIGEIKAPFILEWSEIYVDRFSLMFNENAYIYVNCNINNKLNFKGGAEAYFLNYNIKEQQIKNILDAISEIVNNKIYYRELDFFVLHPIAVLPNGKMYASKNFSMINYNKFQDSLDMETIWEEITTSP